MFPAWVEEEGEFVGCPAGHSSRTEHGGWAGVNTMEPYFHSHAISKRYTYAISIARRQETIVFVNQGITPRKTLRIALEEFTSEESTLL